jgi:Sulfotransferase family
VAGADNSPPVTDSPIFIVGCSRSGTSMLRDLLRSHPNLCFPPESHFIPRFYAAWGDPSSDREARALARRILSLQTIRRWELDLDPPAFASCRSFAEILQVLFGSFARSLGRPRWGDKTPHQVARLPVLAQIFPRARFLHIYRDGRDVALSWVPRRFGPGNVYGAATAWRSLVTAGVRDGAELGERYMQVRYESVLDQPGEEMRAICRFVEEPFADAVLRPEPRTWIYRSGDGVVRERTAIERWNHAKWRDEMPIAERTVFESVAGGLLSELGYEVEGLARPVSRATRVRLRAEDAAGSSLKRVTHRQLSPRNAVLALRAEALGRLRHRF